MYKHKHMTEPFLRKKFAERFEELKKCWESGALFEDQRRSPNVSTQAIYLGHQQR